MSLYYTLADQIALDGNMAWDIEYMKFLEEILAYPENEKISYTVDTHFTYIDKVTNLALRLDSFTSRLVQVNRHFRVDGNVIQYTRQSWFFIWFSMDQYITMFKAVLNKLYSGLDQYTNEEDRGQYYCIYGMIQIIRKQLQTSEPVMNTHSGFLNFYMLKKSAWTHAEHILKKDTTDVTDYTDNPIVKVPLLANNIMRRAFEYV